MRDFYMIVIYADNTGWYTEEELCQSNMVDIKVPADLLQKWYDENPDLEEHAREELGVDYCGLDRWLKDISECDMTDDLFRWLLDHGYTPSKADSYHYNY